MRPVLLLATLALTGCASTVYRLEGEPTTPGGPALTPCESEGWLVMAPTRAEVTSKTLRTSHPENGIGLYRVGSADPESIPGLEGLPNSEMVDRKREAVEPYDRRQVIAGGLGAASLGAIAVGTVLFVNAFGREVDGTAAGIGAGVVGVGFALGIAGLVVSPDHAERTQANATRYVFLKPKDDPKAVEKLVEEHNLAVREACPGKGP